MDRRLPPSHRSSSSASPARAGRYSSIRSSSGSGSSSNAGSSSYHDNNYGASSTGASSPSRAASAYNGVDTTTTIDGTRSNVSAGMSSYERYRSLQSTKPPPTSSTTSSATSTTSAEVPSSTLERQARSSTRMSTTRSDSFSKRSASPIRELRKQRLQQQYTSSTGGRSSSFNKSSPLRSSSPGQSIPRSSNPSSINDNNEEWLNQIRRASAASYDEEGLTAKDKKAKKVKKSARPKSNRKLLSSVVSDDVGSADESKLRKSGRQRSSRRIVTSSITGAPMDEGSKDKEKKKKKRSKSKKSSLNYGSSSDDGSVDDEVFSSAPPPARGTTMGEEPAIQAALSKLGEQKSPQEQTIDGAALARARIYASKGDPTMSSSSYTQQQQQTTIGDGALARAQANSALTASTPPSVPDRSGFGSSDGAARARVRSATGIGSTSSQPPDEKMSTTDSAVRGWSTFRGRHSRNNSIANPFATRTSINEGSKVSEYLNNRKSISGDNPAINSLIAEREKAAQSAKLAANPATPEADSSTFFSGASQSESLVSGTSDEEDGLSSSSSDTDDEMQADHPEWSVRVCVISAIDLPANVVPTVPFSPLLKVGLVRLRDKVESKDEGNEPDRVKQSIHSFGLTGVKKARVRSTSAKVISKRDNGAVEFQEEMRWDSLLSPNDMAFAIELSARAVMTPSNYKESPYEQSVKPLDFQSRFSSRDSSSGRAGSEGRVGLFRRGVQKNPSSEMELAKAAAAVAKHLVEGQEVKEEDGGSSSPTKPTKHQSSSEINVKLLDREKKRKPRLTDDVRLGSQLVPLSKLSWEKALKNNEATRIEQWFELETSASPIAKPGGKSTRNPSVLLEISFSTPAILDDSEDDLEEEGGKAERKKGASYSRRAAISIRSQLRKETRLDQKTVKEEEPALEPGVIDYVCVVGARNIGDQKSDDGASGWVNSSPESCVMEQFPPNPDYHSQNGRNVALPDKVEWFCFPEGCKLWRGTTPPNAEELNLVRFSASSPANLATTIASFDACLGCTSSFSWFVLSSNSDEYGSANQKTYGACIRFFVPAPTGIDPTQDDFGQAIRGAALDDKASKRLWVPMALCITSQLPIVGTMEVMLLRMCEALSSMVGNEGQIDGLNHFFKDVASTVINYQKPIPGVVSSSFPFLGGEPLCLTLPPARGLPPLPHGAAITSVCRLLSANGINFLLAAMLTECKILLHSDDIGNLCLVAEVMTALLYPFTWSLPYIPVLPISMMEFIEAPLSYLLGIPTSCLKLVSRECLEDVVVIDLDKDFSGASGLVDDVGRNSSANAYSKVPTPLPASTAANISKAVYRLLQHNDEDDNDADDGGRHGAFGSSRSFPRLHRETQVEREFRISVALEVAGLVRGYNDHLAMGPSNQPMFNVDKFLQTAPILFDEQRGNSLTASSTLRVLSPRSRRFISILVTCQHFHQFLEVSSSEYLGFFRKVMGELEAYGTKRDLLAVKRVLSLDAQKTIDQLSTALSRIEDKIPVYEVSKSEIIPQMLTPDGMKAAQIAASDFPYSLLRPISMGSKATDSASTERAEGVNQISLEYLVELEKNPWQYQPLIPIELGANAESVFLPAIEKVKLRDAIGERRYLMWKNAAERGDEEDVVFHDEAEGNQTLDWSELLSENVEELSTPESNPQEESLSNSSKRRLSDAKDRDSLRRCLEQARVAGNPASDAEADPNRDLVSEAETALRSPSARRFLLSILNKRSSEAADTDKPSKKPSSSSVSKLEEGAFEVLLRLGCAMLDACIEDRDYDTAYALLKLTAGLYSTVEDSDPPVMLYMTQRLGHHPIYADLGVWLTAKKMHLSATVSSESNEGGQGGKEADEYEAAVATLYEMLGYGIPAEELARFASRVSEENGWFGSERGQSLLLLARRICMRRDAALGSQKTTSDIEMMSPSTTRNSDAGSNSGIVGDTDTDESWTEIGWIHPSAQYSSRFEKDVKRKEKKEGSRSSHMKRSAITSMAYLGSSVVVTGSLDGGVFLARSTHEATEEATELRKSVRGIHLDWGSSGSRFSAPSSSTATDGAYGVGAVSVVAATLPANQSYDALQMTPRPSRKSVTDTPDEEDLVAAMEGCRVVAGTSCGDLRVWSVKDVLSAVFFANRGNDATNNGDGSTEDRTVHRSGEGVSSSIIGNRRRSSEFAAGSSLTRLKFSLRGRALSGHRGGVSCVDVPSHVYRPDSIISGGADGLIKLWSLRTSGAAGRSRLESDQNAFGPTASQDQLSTKSKASSRSGDAMSILSGHGGRILCVKSAWHGDRLLSGGADRTVRLWDLAGSGGKCLSSLSGHFGWVTSVKYWGPNTIISASTDRSIALWDARVRNAPLFTLRHHYAPISDILVGSRTDPIMISAGGDGTIAAWDFRRLSDPSCQSRTSQERQCKVIRRPAGKLYLHEFSSRRRTFGPVLLSRGPCTNSKTVSCLGRDAITREWDIKSGEIVSEHVTGHCDTISSFSSLEGDRLHDPQAETSGRSAVTGTVTTSWDGSVRVCRRS